MPKVGMEPIRREQVRKAASKVISKLGFDRTTLRDIAKAARVSTGTINHYYPNKAAVLIDAFIHVSDWFQDTNRKAVETMTTPEDKLREFIRIGIFDDRKEAQIGQRVWIWAISESLRSPDLTQVITARRKLFQKMLGEVLREFDVKGSLNDDELSELAAECDAYLNGLGIHRATGELNLDISSVERSLILMARARMK